MTSATAKFVGANASGSASAVRLRDKCYADFCSKYWLPIGDILAVCDPRYEAARLAAHEEKTWGAIFSYPARADRADQRPVYCRNADRLRLVEGAASARYLDQPAVIWHGPHPGGHPYFLHRLLDSIPPRNPAHPRRTAIWIPEAQLRDSRGRHRVGAVFDWSGQRDRR